MFDDDLLNEFELKIQVSTKNKTQFFLSGVYMFKNRKKTDRHRRGIIHTIKTNSCITCSLLYSRHVVYE